MAIDSTTCCASMWTIAMVPPSGISRTIAERLETHNSPVTIHPTASTPAPPRVIVEQSHAVCGLTDSVMPAIASSPESGNRKAYMPVVACSWVAYLNGI
jgi:hypothetical protein